MERQETDSSHEKDLGLQIRHDVHGMLRHVVHGLCHK